MQTLNAKNKTRNTICATEKTEEFAAIAGAESAKPDRLRSGQRLRAQRSE